MTHTPGKQLKHIREARGISLEEIAQKTHIRLSYLEALESGDTESLPSRPQMRGFLRLYAGVLGVELEDLEVNQDHFMEVERSSQQEETPLQSEDKQPDLSSEPVAEPVPEIVSQPEEETNPEESIAPPALETETYPEPLAILCWLIKYDISYTCKLQKIPINNRLK